MEEAYGAAVLPVNCEQLKKEDVEENFRKGSFEFPVTEIDFCIPKWLELLSETIRFKETVIGLAGSLLEKAGQMKDMELSDFDLGEGIETISVDCMDLSNGKVSVTICPRGGLLLRSHQPIYGASGIGRV